MDSSGSMQSSSGGEDEYDSRESISSFLNHPSAGGHFGSISDPNQPPQFLAQQPTNLFNISDAFPQSLGNSSSISTSAANTHQFGNDFLWSRSATGVRSEPPNFSNFAYLTGLSSSSSTITASSRPSSSSTQSVLVAPFASAAAAVGSTSSISMPTQSSIAPSDHHQQPAGNMVVKNPKKRTRASRRAPTTVLTTDTTNFRQMVQEFTGIPTAPFSGGGSPYSRRLDLFSASGSVLGPLYPLRPSAQKVQLSPFLPPNSSLLNSSGMNMIDALVSSANTANSNAVNASSSNEFPMTSDISGGISRPPQNLLGMQNHPMLSFQPTTVLGSKSQGNSTTIPSFDELGNMGSHENVNANISSGIFQSPSSSYNNKFNCSVSTSEFHPDKGLENVTSGGEGTVGSWMCPSD